MAMCILLLRGVNVSGKNPVAMADLRALLEAQGAGEVSTLLQSGNAVFRAPSGARAAFEKRLAGAIARRFGDGIDCFVRTADEWRKAIAANPFKAEAKRDPGRMVLVALGAPPPARAVAALAGAIVGRERVAASGAHLYAVYPDGQGRSKLTLTLIERHLGTRGTARNWNTVIKLAERADGN